MGSHSVTCHPTQVNTPRLTPAIEAGNRFTYPRGMEGWVDLGGWLHIEMVYLYVSHKGCYVVCVDFPRIDWKLILNVVFFVSDAKDMQKMHFGVRFTEAARILAPTPIKLS